MKKQVLLFISFCIVYVIVLFGIYKYASPDRTLENAIDSESLRQIETASGTYIGDTFGTTFQGIGQFEFLSGEKYIGSWEDSQMQGDGSILFSGAGKYEGEFVDGQRVGKGEFIWDDGDKYSGEWANDTMTGDGTYTFGNGCTISGAFKNNVLIGIVEYKTPDGFIYKGDAPQADKLLNAEITYSDGNKYSGGIKNGLRSGNGKFTWYSNGLVQASYDGNWEDDKMNGNGSYYYTPSFHPKLTGVFQNGVPTGNCIYRKDPTYSFDTTWENGECVSIKER